MSHIAAWGFNQQGQLGTGYQGKLVLEPVDAVPVGDRIKSASTGGNYSLALIADGTVSAWGDNVNASLGDGTLESTLLPVKALVGGVKQLASAGGHAIVLLNNGTVMTWGANAAGQIGDGSSNKGEANKAFNKPTPVALALKDVIHVAAGGACCAATFADGTVAAWGENTHGACIPTPSAEVAVPAIVAVSGVVKVAIGGHYTLATHMLALHGDGTVTGWGAGRHGAIIDPGTHPAEHEVVPPTTIPGLEDIVDIAAGTDCSYALTAVGDLLAWGLNTNFQLGIPGASAKQVIPVPTLVMREVSKMSFGGGTSAAISHGELFTWGGNSYGECGLGSTTDVPLPTQVPSLGDIEDVAVGDTHMLCLLRGPMHAPPVSVTPGPGSLTVAWESPAVTGKWLVGIRPKGEGARTRTTLEPSARGYTFRLLAAGKPYEIEVQNVTWGRRGVEGVPL
jgi:alpha-tubulin suppressor-like RCC1 family protein